MILITTLDNPRMAQAFADYMKQHGVFLMVQHNQHSDIWLPDDSKADKVQAELALFLANPNDARYMAASWKTGKTGTGLRYQPGAFFATIWQRAGPITLLITFFCINVYMSMRFGGDRGMMSWLGWPIGSVQRIDIWRYFSHILLHFSLLHILFNLLWWWYLGGAVEKRLGSGKLIVITLISALLSGFVQNAMSGPMFGGLSGVVYALMGYVWLRGEREPDSGLYMQRGLIVFAVLWIVAGFFDIFGMPIANGAHIAGLIVGLVIALVDTLHVRKRT